MMNAHSPISPDDVRKAEFRATLREIESMVEGKVETCIREVEGIEGSDDLVLMRKHRVDGRMLNMFRHHVPF